MAHEIFISYSRKDIRVVTEIKKYIDNAVGINCWFDINGIESGEQFMKVIIAAIRNHDTILFMKSAQSMQSEWALDELDFAKHKNKRIILVHIDDSEMTDDFYFLYHKYDQIIWKDPIQRDKLINNLKNWFSADSRTNFLYGNETIRKAEDEKEKRLEVLEEPKLTPVKVNGAYGFVNKSGQLVIPSRWKFANNFSEGMARVEDDNGKYGFIDKTGQLKIPCKWKLAGSFSEGLASVKNDNEKYGYIDKSGNIRIPYNWEFAGPFSEGLAPVRTISGKCGYINKIGETVIPCRWNNAYPFSRGFAKVQDASYKWWTIDKTGKIVK